MAVNKIIQEFYRKYFQPIKVFKVKSKTNFNPDLGEFEKYDVELWEDGEICCNCMAGGYKRPCYHKQQTQRELEKEFGSIEKAVEFYRNKNK